MLVAGSTRQPDVLMPFFCRIRKLLGSWPVFDDFTLTYHEIAAGVRLKLALPRSTGWTSAAASGEGCAAAGQVEERRRPRPEA